MAGGGRCDNCPCERGKIFNVVGFAMGIVMVIAGIVFCQDSQKLEQARTFILGIYYILFGILACLVETMDFTRLRIWAPFLCSYPGRGVFWIFWGILIGDGKEIWIALSIFFVAFGVLLCTCAPFFVQDGVSLGPTFLIGGRSAALPPKPAAAEPAATPRADPYLATTDRV
ncbi:hypothetical protein M885DRAFT_518543 [Pelagophyceae sp. CCMP2097]|nr:hypothetical protein M885DRAFT_518543 [Pelagophyceae sp. CCMP2097]